MTELSNISPPENATAVIVTDTGHVFWGKGLGAATAAIGEICFNTAMTGYQETITDPSYAGQIITFTFPHVGNVGVNEEDQESTIPSARGVILREDITNPSSWRASQSLNHWLQDIGMPGICGVDTRALTCVIRDHGAPKGIVYHNPKGVFDLNQLQKDVRAWVGLEGTDLAKEVSCTTPYEWQETRWQPGGYGRIDRPLYHVVAVDYGVKRNILRCLASVGCRVTVVPAQTSADEILAYAPNGIFLSNGPGDPAATGLYAVPIIQKLMESGLPIFGICLGHQMLARALGAETRKMHLGHRGVNHPVKDIQTGKVEITSQNHGFEVMAESFSKDIIQTHVSLFDGSNEGLRCRDKPVFSVQYHPEASPGPEDSYYLFERFVDLMAAV